MGSLADNGADVCSRNAAGLYSDGRDGAAPFNALDRSSQDNFNLGNSIKACGHYDAGGGWVQMYNGTNSPGRKVI